MLKSLSRVILQTEWPGLLKWSKNFNLNTCSENLCRSLCVIKRQKNTKIASNSLSKKVLQYMRNSSKYASLLTSLPDHMFHTNPWSTYEIHRMLLLLADSKECKPCDFMTVFSQYISQKQYILQDIAMKKTLMLKVKDKLFQAIPHMTIDDLQKFSITLKYLEFKKSKYLMSIATSIEKECGRRALVADLEQCLKLFDVLLLLHGNSLQRRKQFDIFISLFEMHTSKATPYQLVQILHYIGIAKKTKLNQEYVRLLIANLQEIFEQLPFIDAGIAVEGIFKCNVKLDKSSLLVRNTARCLKMKGEKIEIINDLESYAFIAMIKVLRAAKYRDETLLKSVSTFVMKLTPDACQPELIAHILAFYANMHIYDPDVFAKFECLILKHMKGHSYGIRSKDISRILWSFSHVWHKLNDNFYEIVDKLLLILLHKGEFDLYPEHLSSSLFSLAVYGHYPKELTSEAFKPQSIEKLQGYQRSKQLSRLLGLREAIKIEAPEVFVHLSETYASVVPKRTISDEMLYRPAFAKVMKGVKYINKSTGACILEPRFPIRFINYASLVYDGRELTMQNVSKNFALEELTSARKAGGAKRIAIEIIDSHSLILGGNHIGLLEMKLRLMIQCGWLIYRIFEDDINRYNCDGKTMAALILDTLSKRNI